MKVRWFGPAWDAPINDPECEVAAPLGEFCIRCNEKIEPGERGLLMWCSPGIDGSFSMWIDGQDNTVCAYHIDCFLESVLGENYRSLETGVDRRPRETE